MSAVVGERRPTLWLASFAALLVIACGDAGWAQAPAAPDGPPQWYEIAAGVLAIPATMIGIVYSYVLLVKTRAETEKTKLEIREKRAALDGMPDRPTPEADQALADVIRENVIFNIVLRFVLLSVVLYLWDIVISVFGIVVGGAYLSLQALVESIDLSRWTVVIFAVQQVPEVIRAVIIVAFGWPLLKDINRYLGASRKRT